MMVTGVLNSMRAISDMSIFFRWPSLNTRTIDPLSTAGAGLAFATPMMAANTTTARIPVAFTTSRMASLLAKSSHLLIGTNTLTEWYAQRANLFHAAEQAGR